MNKCVLLFALVLCIQVVRSQSLPASQKERFAGLHFDFHAMLNDTTIGSTFTEQIIDSLLTMTKPDFIQVDCKGHPGISSYPTKAGNKPGAFSKDILRIWRDVTARHQIPLYVHYSGVWDTRAVELNPSWARTNADDRPDANAVSLMGEYPEKLMHQQLAELAEEYQLDGAWIDGDCWVLGNDYSPVVMSAFSKQSGIATAPRNKTDPGYFEWMEFNRALFRKYIANYVAAAHEARPGFKITSNWSFSSMMPEKVDIPVDFLSGDVSGTNSLYSSAFESRCLALQGKPWDLMSWSFAWKNELKATKSVPQMQQEAAEVLAMGGGFQTYWQQNRDGTPEPYHFQKMADLIRFSHERRAYTFDAKVVPQIGLLYSTYTWKRIPVNGLYSAHSQEAMKGNLNMLLDSQLPVDIVMDHQLDGRLEKYPLIVLPEWEKIDPVVHKKLLQYVENGGRLLVVGAKATRDFMEPLGAGPAGNLQKDTTFFAGFGNQTVILKTNFQQVFPTRGAKGVGVQLNADDFRFASVSPLATVRDFGKGRIAGVFMDIGSFYTKNKNPVIPALLAAVIDSLQPALKSSVSGSSQLHQVLAEKDGKQYLHLINTSGPHDNPNVMVYEEVTPLRAISASVQLDKKPKQVRLQPGNHKLKYHYQNQKLSFQVPELTIHSIVEIE